MTPGGPHSALIAVVVAAVGALVGAVVGARGRPTTGDRHARRSLDPSAGLGLLLGHGADRPGQRAGGFVRRVQARMGRACLFVGDVLCRMVLATPSSGTIDHRPALPRPRLPEIPRTRLPVPPAERDHRQEPVPRAHDVIVPVRLDTKQVTDERGPAAA